METPTIFPGGVTATLTFTGAAGEVAALAKCLGGEALAAPEAGETYGLPGAFERQEELAAAKHDLDLLCGLLLDLGLWASGVKLPALRATLETMQARARQREDLMKGFSARGICGLGAEPHEALAALDKRLQEAKAQADLPWEADAKAQAPDAVADAPADAAAPAAPEAPAWASVPEAGKRVQVTYLATGEVHEGNVREVDMAARRFTYGRWDAPDRVAAEGQTLWAPVPSSYPPGLTKEVHDAHKKELRAAKVPLAKISPWRTYDQLADGSWKAPAAPPGIEPPPTQAPAAPAEAPAAAPAGDTRPRIGAEVGLAFGGQTARGLVVSHQDETGEDDGDAYTVVCVGEIEQVLLASTSTWSYAAEPLPWASPAAGDRIEVGSTGSRLVQGVVTRAALVDRWGYSAFEWLPDGTQDPVMAYLGRNSARILPPAAPAAPTPAEAPAPAPTPHQPPMDWLTAQPLASLHTGARAWAWLDHGGWPPSGPGRLEVVTVIAVNGREVKVQLDTGPQVDVDMYDLKAAP